MDFCRTCETTYFPYSPNFNRLCLDFLNKKYQRSKNALHSDKFRRLNILIWQIEFLHQELAGMEMIVKQKHLQIKQSNGS